MAEEHLRLPPSDDRAVRLRCLELAQRITVDDVEDDEAIVRRAGVFADFVIGAGDGA